MIELDSNVEANIDFYKYLSSRVTDIKIDMYKTAAQHDLSNAKIIAAIIGLLEGMEITIDSSFSVYMCSNENHENLYDIIIARINKKLDGKLDKDQITSFSLAANIIENTHKEWQESRKDNSNGND